MFQGRSVRAFGQRAEAWLAGFAPSDPGLDHHRRDLWIGLAAVVLVWLVAWLQWSLFDLVVPWDSKNQFYAFFRFMAGAIHDGSTPFWNPYHYAGHPSVADPQSLIFNPPFLIWAFFQREPSLLAFDLAIYAHLLVGGLAIVVHGRRFGWPVAASVLAACIFMLGGVVSSRMNHTGIIIAFGLFPLAWLLLDVALERRSHLAAIGFALVAAQIALGRTQTPMLLCAVLALIAIRNIVVQPQPLRFLLSRATVILTMGFVGFAVLIVPLLLTAQFAAFSNRPDIEIENALSSSLFPPNIANFIAPNVLGSLNPSEIGDWGPSHGTRPGIDSTDRSFNYMFMGSLTALLILWHGLAGGRIVASGRRMIAFVALAGLAYALGRYTPVFPFLFEHVGAIRQFRRPVGGLFLLVLAFAYLAGWLVSDYVRRGLPKAPRWALALVGLLVLGVIGWAIQFSGRSGKSLQATVEVLKVLPIYAGLGLLLVVAAASARARLVAASIAVAFTAGELVWRNAASSMNAEPRAYYAALERPDGETAEILAVLRREIAARTTGAHRPRVEVVGLGGPWQNAAMIYGLEATNGYNPLRIGAYDRLVSPGESPYVVQHRLFPASFPGYDSDLARVLGLEYVVLDRPIELMPNLARWRTRDMLVAGPKVWIYRLPSVAPRVALAGTVRIADADMFIDGGRYPTGLGSSEVMVDDDDDLRQTYAQIARQPGRAEIVSWRPDRIEIAVETSVNTVLTLHESWYPGWEVEVDGERRPLLRTDVLFRGVEVPAGARRVVFTFRPLSLENLTAALNGVLGRDE
jgi:preprotein translocase subunit Sss1